jgi:hypothetical protein
MLSFAPLAKLRYFMAPFLLAIPLLLAGQAAAAPTTDNPPVAKTTRPAPKKTDGPAVQASKPATLVVATVAAAPQTVQVKGIVLAPDGRPCAGASVYPAGAPRQLVVTDAQGAFALPVPAGEAVSLRVEYFGEGASRVEVPSPGTALVRVTLGQ